MAFKASVIIPIFNEGDRILPLISVISTSSVVAEIIVVDDGSSLKTKNILSQIKGINLITHPKNLGKSQALKTGILTSKSPIIVFVDSDLSNFKSTCINQLLEPFNQTACCMVIGEIDGGFKFYNDIGLTALLSGLRAFRRSLLIKHLDIFADIGYRRGFLIESKMNQLWLRQNTVKVKFPFIKQPYKCQKIGLIKGFVKDIGIMSSIITYCGFVNFLKMLRLARRLPSTIPILNPVVASSG